jgi:hypothetical protein
MALSQRRHPGRRPDTHIFSVPSVALILCEFCVRLLVSWPALNKCQKSPRYFAVGCATLYLRLLLLYRLWSRKVGRKVTLAAFFYAQWRPVTLLRGSESRHQIAHHEYGPNPAGLKV